MDDNQPDKKRNGPVPMPLDLERKTCTLCGIEKDRSCFHKSKTSGGGIKSQCTACLSAIGKDKRKDNPKRTKFKPKSKPEDHQTKVCNICLVEKSRDEFDKRESGIGGLRASCKDCNSEIKKNRYALKHQKKIPTIKVRPEKPQREPLIIGGIVVTKTCCNCNITMDTTNFYFASTAKDKLSSYCRLCDKQLREARRLTIKGRYDQIKCDAKRFKHGWDITLDEFKQFWQKPCTYCGCEMKTTGLDRVDTTGIYSVSNVNVSCHSCNQFKLDQPLDDWFAQVKRLHDNIDNIINIKSFDCQPNTTHCFICGLDLIAHQKKCKSFQRKMEPGAERKTKEQRARDLAIYEQTPRGKYSTYQKKAKFKGIGWDLSKDHFFSMWKKPCFYCGAEIKTIGIDRIDSNGPYSLTKNGLIPCCRFCNAGKMDHSIGDFVTIIDMIAKKQNIE